MRPSDGQPVDWVPDVLPTAPATRQPAGPVVSPPHPMASRHHHSPLVFPQSILPAHDRRSEIQTGAADGVEVARVGGPSANNLIREDVVLEHGRARRRSRRSIGGSTPGRPRRSHRARGEPVGYPRLPPRFQRQCARRDQVRTGGSTSGQALGRGPARGGTGAHSCGSQHESRFGSGLCGIFGTTVPFSAAKLAELYPTHADFVKKWDEATAAEVKEGYLLPADAQALDTVAAQSSLNG